MSDITRYVVAVRFHDESLTEINELHNHLIRAGFLLTLADDDGNVHELGTNTFGIITPQSEDEIVALTTALAETALGQKPDVKVTTFDSWLKETEE